MRKYTYLVIAWLMCILACKNEKGAESNYPKPMQSKSVQDNIFKVLLNVKVREDDKFQLFYVDDTSEGEYKANKRIVTFVSGKNEFQVVEFMLPLGVIPYKFRIDVGEKNINTLIEIREVKLGFNTKVIEINHKVFSRFFEPNIYLRKVKDGYMRTPVDGKCDPFFRATSLLIKKIELEF